MAKIKQRGKAGAAKAYITRSAAVKKLQCSLADFRRLCILKGIFPREPRHKKRANKGSSAPTSFYYSKDIAYLAHEPVLKKLREHKAFAKKLARALGRGEWSSAKSLEDNRPVYTLDHIVKERYPTFIDAVRDIDDALCLITLFASLPTDGRIPKSLIENCARLSAEWQLYIMRTRSLTKSFLSIKGVYFQAEVMEQTITWMVPYQFTQTIPSDVDVRIMLTFLEFYQTLLGFVFFKLYTDMGIAYPPPLDEDKDEAGAGVGAFVLKETTQERVSSVLKETDTAKSKASAKDVRDAIKSLATVADAPADDAAPVSVIETSKSTEEDDSFVPQPSKSNPQEATALLTLKDISAIPQSSSTTLFAPYTFYLSREVSRPLFEFMIQSFGGRVGWPASSGSGSPVQESDSSVTHVIIDRPAPQSGNGSQRRDRKYVQPQWVVDCINAGRILPEDAYAQGKTLPPHLSPFGEEKGAYVPLEVAEGEDVAMEGSDEDVSEDEGNEVADADASPIAIGKVANDPESLRQAELEAEVRGVNYDAFAKEVGKAVQQSQKTGKVKDDSDASEKDMNKMMMSRKQRKLYEKVKYSQNKKNSERELLEAKRQQLKKEKRRKGTS